MKKNKDTRKIWLVEHPLHQFNENVKELARRENLKIIDAKFDIKKDLLTDSAPKITKKKVAKPEVKKDA